MVWVIGSNGMLGQEVCRQLTQIGMTWIGSGSEVDITKAEDLETFTQSHDQSANRTGYSVAKKRVPAKIEWVINCAAYTDVEGAEDEPEKAMKVNAEGALNIARATRKIGAKFIHFSTDYVFDGRSKTPYTEDNPRNPLGVYGKSKCAGEEAIQKEMTQYYIIRSSWLYGFDRPNFVYKMISEMSLNDTVEVVEDQKGSPTFAGNLANVAIKIMQTSINAHHLFGKNAAIPYGVYHYADSGEATWCSFAEKIYTLAKKYKRLSNNCKVVPCSSAERESKVIRPAYSVLSTSKITSAMKIKVPAWEESLEKFIKSDLFNPKPLEK